MGIIKRISKKVWLILLLGLMIEVLFDPLSRILNFSENIQARVGLPHARAKWDAQKVNHYKFDIRGFIPLQCFFSGNIEVKEGKVVSTEMRSEADKDPFVGLGTMLSEGSANSPFLCNYHNYTVPHLFDELQRWSQESPSYITRISFDSKYGFISDFGFGFSGGRGLLSPEISDCCGGFTIENFEVLDE
jgi:hypothetical protein